MSKSKDKMQVFTNDLAWLAESVTLAIENNADGSIQRDQVELLMALEQKFRKSVIKFAQCREIYKKFILLVAVENRNILSARPYFREKATVFSSSITPAIKASDIKTLQTFHLNFNLIKFIRDSWLGKFPKDSEELYGKIAEARRKLVENNMPLAINRAKLFYRKVPQNHVSLMDMIGIAAMGLVSGVDKWVGDYTRVFNGVCIGRMTGNMIDNYSETTLHFYPSDRSILYRANSLRFRNSIEDLEELANTINVSYAEDAKTGMRVPKHKITAAQLSELLAAASPFSYDTPIDDDKESERLIDLHAASADMSHSAEQTLIDQDMVTKMVRIAKKLPLIQQKILKLKGVYL